jgi:hypothetical protein
MRCSQYSGVRVCDFVRFFFLVSMGVFIALVVACRAPAPRAYRAALASLPEHSTREEVYAVFPPVGPLEGGAWGMIGDSFFGRETYPVDSEFQLEASVGYFDPYPSGGESDSGTIGKTIDELINENPEAEKIGEDRFSNIRIRKIPTGGGHAGEATGDVEEREDGRTESCRFVAPNSSRAMVFRREGRGEVK